MPDATTIIREFAFHLATARAGAKQLRAGPKHDMPDTGRIPRVARMLALAHHFEERVREGEMADYADLARCLGWSRARVTQMMDLLLLAPDIQEAVLFLPAVHGSNRDPITEQDVRKVAAVPAWEQQRGAWHALCAVNRAVNLVGTPLPRGPLARVSREPSTDHEFNTPC
jgi:hypothetical protein